MHEILFLPGMSGQGSFWEPVQHAITTPHEATLLDWPGLGENPVDPNVSSYDDFVELVRARINSRAVLVAQSMGGYVAVRTALRYPEVVSHLVLSATSGGIDLAPFGADDWRPGSRKAHPTAPPWVFEPTEDLTDAIRTVDVPTLLVWATADAISPLAVGEHLEGLFPNARLVTFDCDDHWVARIHADEVAAAIDALLATDSDSPKPG